MHINVNLPFKTWKERESSITFEKCEPALVEYLSHQFMKACGEIITHVSATVLHYFVYFSISKFLPKMQFTSETGEIWGHSQIL